MALSNKGCVKIGATEICPQSLKIQYDSISAANSGRTDDGVMHITWVKRAIPKLEINMPPMTPTQLSALLTLVQGRTYNMTYFDVKTNAEVTAQFYTSNSSADLYSGILNSSGLYIGVSFNAIGTGA